eukprot:9000983-Prorocentrum_lima.AAC.1
MTTTTTGCMLTKGGGKYVQRRRRLSRLTCEVLWPVFQPQQPQADDGKLLPNHSRPVNRSCNG